ncbi:MAG: MBL fold metallo-hydrolase [Bacteroidota bacterium]
MLRQTLYPNVLLLLLPLFFSCTAKETSTSASIELGAGDQPYLMVLGIAQDAGYPQAACQKSCCQAVWKGGAEEQLVSCLGLIDPVSNELWLLDATPDFREQWQYLQAELKAPPVQPTGVLITHAHIGHYTGLMQLGREVMSGKKVPVYTMARMRYFVRRNGPWSQLVDLENIQLMPIQHDSAFVLNERLQVTPLLVPHRDEYSETVGYRVEGPKASLLFIPDIDKWERWDRRLEDELALVDYAFLDATFYADGELPNRDMSKIPHPFVAETMSLLADLTQAEKEKVHFIHLNHTNPLLQEGSLARQEVHDLGFSLAQTGLRLPL